MTREHGTMTTRNSIGGYRTNRRLISFASLIAGISVGVLIAATDCIGDSLNREISLIVAYPFFQFVLPGFLLGRKATSRGAADLFFDSFFVSIFGAAKAALTSLLLGFVLTFRICEQDVGGYYMWAVVILSIPLSPIAGATAFVTARWFRARKLRAAHGESRMRPDL